MKFYFFVFPVVLMTAIYFLPLRPLPVEPMPQFHFEGDRLVSGELPEEYNDLFAGSGNCALCHNAQVDGQGNPIPIVDSWRATMMANAARDPFWRAKVSHEALVNPEHKEALENLCTRCHAPAGQVNAHYNGQELYSIAEMENDPLALDGVQCTVCHQITEASLGNYSGQFEIGEDHVIWGAYADPLTMPMINHTGYTPAQGVHINDAAMCGSCHTLITQSVDGDGNPTGNSFVEQAVYHEWLNSKYAVEQTTCQACHVPRIDDPVVIASMPPWLDTERAPFGLHTFQGANVFMLNMLKTYADELNLTATPEQFDAAIANNLHMLQEQTLEVFLQETARTADSLYLELEMLNLAGHKFPSGYPSRRFFVELLVQDAQGNVLFHSGAMDDEGQLLEEDFPFEPHYDLITSEDQVQIYELVMGDVNHEFTTVLERANFALKDNRLPPQGFSSEHYAYDTVQVVGAALLDADFNQEAGMEGSGRDVLHFRIPLNGYSGSLSVVAKLYYQTVSSKWLEEMFAYSSPEIDLFKSFYEAMDKTPVLVEEAMLLVSSSRDIWPDYLQINPTLTRGGELRVFSSSHAFRQISVYGPSGKLLYRLPQEVLHEREQVLQLPEERGAYLIEVKTDEGRYLKKVIKY